MANNRTRLVVIPAAAALLLWPALWNGYPIVFADTGTYLSQAIHMYAGWDRPVFYSLFLFPLHWTVTLWPVIVAQALLATWILALACRIFVPSLSPWMFLAGMATLSAGTCLPWIVSQIMPDLLTPLLILTLCLLICASDRLSRTERCVLAGLAAFMIATQWSSLPLSAAIIAILWLSRSFPRRHWRPALVLLPLVLAVLTLCSVNLAAFNRFVVSPFGNVFLLARVIYDGPGMTTLRTECPTQSWLLCPYLSQFPATSDEFLWSPDSPLAQAGGPKRVSHDADAIISMSLLRDPIGEAEAALRNTIEQLSRFDSGDGLTQWPDQVTSWIQQDFPPREYAAYAAAKQQSGQLAMPPILIVIHRAIALAGIAACLLLLPFALRDRAPFAGLLLAVVLAQPVSAAITGALSTPHDRYQSRIIWLPPLAAAIALFATRQRQT